MKTKGLRKRYEKACIDYIELFCKKHDVDFHFWVGEEVGSVVCINNDFFFSFTDITFDINTDQVKNKIFEWNEHNERYPNHISYNAYCKGFRHDNNNDFNF